MGDHPAHVPPRERERGDYSGAVDTNEGPEEGEEETSVVLLLVMRAIPRPGLEMLIWSYINTHILDVFGSRIM